jgi:hypothetical protein
MPQPRDPLARKNGRRRRALLLAAELAIKLHRPPTRHELGIALGISYGNVHAIVDDCIRYGLVHVPPDRQHGQVLTVIPSPLARIRLEMPLLVYLSWPLPPPSAPDEAHEAAYAVGKHLATWIAGRVPRAAPVSPYLVKHDRRVRPHLDAAAPVLALGCHAAIIYRDPLLAGRADAAAARDAGLPTALITSEFLDSYQPSRGDEIWAAPYLLTPEPRTLTIHGPRP